MEPPLFGFKLEALKHAWGFVQPMVSKHEMENMLMDSPSEHKGFEITRLQASKAPPFPGTKSC